MNACRPRHRMGASCHVIARRGYDVTMWVDVGDRRDRGQVARAMDGAAHCRVVERRDHTWRPTSDGLSMARRVGGDGAWVQ